MESNLSGGAVVLAAGASTRFGSDKRHHRLADGRTLFEATLAVYQCVFDNIFIVLKPADETWARRHTDVQPVYAPESALGMGHSLAAGVQAARHLDFLFIALADMPHVRAATLTRLNDAMAGTKSIVQPVYRGVPGHPVGFGRSYFGELARLTGDSGARRIVDTHIDRVARIELNDAGIVQDIDVLP